MAIGPRAADQALLETMALLDPTTENLLQEIALELAFAPTGGHQSVVTLLQALRQLQQLGQAQEAIENLVNWLAPLEASGEALAEGDADFGHAVGDLGPQLLVLVVDEPDAAAVGADEIAGHVGVEPEDGVGFAGLADPGGVGEDHSRNLFVALHGFLDFN